MHDKEVWGIFNTTMNEYIFLLVHKNKDVQRYSKIIRNILKQTYEINQETKIKQEDCLNISKAITYINDYLKGIKEILRQPILVIIQSHYTIEHLKSMGVKILIEELPAMYMSPLEIQSNMYSALDWQVKGIKFICENYCEIPAQLSNLINLSSYAYMPLCNSCEQEDHINNIIDIIFARMLKGGNFISWYDDYNNQSKNVDYRQLIPSDYIQS